MVSLSVSRALEAAVTIFATTADDALWLIPFVASPTYSSTYVRQRALGLSLTGQIHSKTHSPANNCFHLLLSSSSILPGFQRMLHAATFVSTLQFVVLLSAVLANAMKLAVNRKMDEALPLVGAIVAWIITLYLYMRSVLKRRKRQMETQKSLLPSSEGDQDKLDSKDINYGSVEEKNSLAADFDSHSCCPERDASQVGPIAVFSLAFVGALDELTYFPTLIIGGTFSAVELSVGALLACLLTLIVITSVLSMFQPVLEWMDRIPLYVIVGLFATILSIEALMTTSGEKDLVFISVTQNVSEI